MRLEGVSSILQEVGSVAEIGLFQTLIVPSARHLLYIFLFDHGISPVSEGK